MVGSCQVGTSARKGTVMVSVSLWEKVSAKMASMRGERAQGSDSINNELQAISPGMWTAAALAGSFLGILLVLSRPGTVPTWF